MVDLRRRAESLVRGQRALTSQHEYLGKMHGMGFHTPRERSLTKGLGQWDQLEKSSREMGLQGCIHGPGKKCPETAVVSCRTCAERDDRPAYLPV